MSAGLPNISSVYAREGTCAHWLAERALRMGQDPGLWLDTTHEVDGEQITITEEMVDAVRVYTDYCLALINTGPDGSQFWIEQRFNLAKLNPPAPMFGTSDFSFWNTLTREFEIVDFKYGQGVLVQVRDNSQLRYYALGAVVTIGRRPVKVTTTIVQPRVHHPDSEVRSASYTFAEIVAFKEALFTAARNTQAEDAPLVPGDHCQFCPALAICSAHHQLVQSVAQTEFTVDEPATPPAPDKLTVDQLQLVLQHADTIEDWLGAVRAHVAAMLERGESVPGWKLVDKRATRRWDDEDKAKEFLEFSLASAAFAPPKLVSPAKAEELLKQIKVKLPAELVTKVSSGKKLAPESDSRPARLPSAQTDFDGTTEN